MSSSNAIRSLSNALGGAGAGADGDPMPPSAGGASSADLLTKVPMTDPTTIVIVIDTSGSMVLSVGDGEQKVFSRLDLARRAALLVAFMLREEDTLVLITFSIDAQVLLPPTKMTATNKEHVMSLLASLREGGSTNLVAGLQKAVKTVAASPDAHILVLTDGEADVGQTVGILSDEIRRADYRGTLSTVGFTYASKSDDLSALATLGRGCFGFVPSSDMLITVILNWISRRLANEPIKAPSAAVSAYIAVLKMAYSYATAGSYPAARDALEAYRTTLFPGSVFLEDIMGEVGMAVSRPETFRHWGCHYLLALISAHEQQHCSNFKDPSVQPYATPRFKAIQAMGVGVFESLPTLTGSLAVSEAHRVASAVSGRAASDMFLNSSGPCFAPSATVHLHDGVKISLDELRPGMVIKTLEGSSRIQVVVKTMTPSPVLMGNGITAWHPVLHNGKWAFPFDVFPMEEIKVDCVYNILFEDRTQTVLVNDVPCCTLAHGKTGPVIGHKFWGTEAVLTSLAKLRGWDVGYITLNKYFAVRDPEGRVIDIQNVDDTLTA